MTETDEELVSADLAALFFLAMGHHLPMVVDGVDYVISRSSRDERQRVIGEADKIIVSVSS